MGYSVKHPTVLDMNLESAFMTKEIFPYTQIVKGEDSLSESDELIFSDFRPRIKEDKTPDPKDLSAPAPADSSELQSETEPTTPAMSAQELADAENLKEELEEASKQTGSSDPKSG